MVKNHKVANQSSVMISLYVQMLYSLMEQEKFEEEDYIKLVGKVWESDSNLLDYREFNKKWEGICRFLKIGIEYTDNDKNYLNSNLIEKVASSLYENRHIFQQYKEQSEKRRKTSEAILNDPKYDY